MNIYIDMDDVVADWAGYARELLKKPDLGITGEPLIKTEDWPIVVQQQRMYRDLKVKDGAKSLIAWLTWYKTANPDTELFFLTAVPHGNDMPYSFMDKVTWAQKHFPNIPVFFGPYSHEKYIRCTPGDILIDDRTSNCVEWRREGGLAHEYRTWEECKPWLEQTLNFKL
jgi:5'(3')-deoxyribonucleotidase